VKNNDRLAQAYEYCQSVAKSHYENFPVASLLIPSELRRHVYAIYAFARYADDLSDEKKDKHGLLQWKLLLHQSLEGKAEHPIFIALSDTIEKFNLPVELFDKLIAAFLQDLEKNRYENFDLLFQYCENSANPVGRLILLLNGYHEEELFLQSDYICTALQLTNFWQDVEMDIKKNRIYIPADSMKQNKVAENQIKDKIFDNNFRNLMISLVKKTDDLFKKGFPLFENVHGRLKWELKLTAMGGRTILKKIEHIEYNVLNYRPKLNLLDWTKILINFLLNKNI
jgi:hydroxysqualene synthase